MFLVYGKRTARIKKYSIDSQPCGNCKSFGADIKVYGDYYHFFFIPIIPIGIKSARIYCTNCDHRININSLEQEYEERTRAPFYLYTGVLIFAAFVLFAISSNLSNRKENAKLVDNPMVGDVYRIRKNENNAGLYYFLRINDISGSGDTISSYHSNLVYKHFTDEFNADDFFDSGEQLLFTKADIKRMLEKGEIESVERGYEKDNGFNRIK